ncbi:MAG TPA: cytochrome P450 [Ilumatobacter sp.]|nr:cytochrome P450 [Ilumatobacter sp.]
MGVFDITDDGRRVRADPHDPAFYGDPYALYTAVHADAAQRGAVPAFEWEEYGFWCFAGFDEVSALLRDRRFGRGPGLPERTERIANWWETERWSLLAIDPPEHTQMRGLVNRAFLSRQVERLRPRIAELADQLLAQFGAADGPVDLLRDYAAPLPAVVIAELIGLPGSDARLLLDWSNRMVRMYMFESSAEARAATEADADVAAAEFIEYVRAALAEHRANPRDDLLTHMLEATEDRPDGPARLSEGEVIATAILLLNAGHEATVHTTGNAVRLILDSGHDPGELFATPEQASATVEECLRFDAPLHLFTRYALEDAAVELGAGEWVTFERGQQVGLLLGAANRDPRRFADADRFDPFRPDGGNVSFGSGIHFCIGAPLARIELETSLRAVFTTYPDIALAEPPQYRDIFHFHGLDRLLVNL